MKSLIDTYSKQQLQQVVKECRSYKQFAEKIGYKAYSGDLKELIEQRFAELGIDTSHFSIYQPNKIKRTRENIFIKNSSADQTTLRRWYSKENIPYVCAICGQKPFWQGRDLTLILDHINGDNHDDRLENLRWVCPNCNQQLPTTNKQKR